MLFEQVGNGFARGYYVRSPDSTRNSLDDHSCRAFAPAAVVASSVTDMSRFLSWHFRLLENGGDEIMKATTLKKIQRVHWIGADLDEPA